MKKDERHEMRLEPSLKVYLKNAAKFDNKNLTAFLLQAALDRANMLRTTKGWKAKEPPQPRDARRKEVHNK